MDTYYARLSPERRRELNKRNAARSKLNVARVRETKALRRTKAYEWVNQLKKSRGCTDCGNKDPRVLQFDHVRDKKANVCDLVAEGYSLERIQEEVAKCEIRCANCHTIKTLERLAHTSEGALWRSPQSLRP